MCIVFYKAEAAGRFVEAVETHDETFYLAAFCEEFVDLLFGCVEGSVFGGLVWATLVMGNWRGRTDFPRRGLSHLLRGLQVLFRGSSLVLLRRCICAFCCSGDRVSQCAESREGCRMAASLFLNLTLAW